MSPAERRRRHRRALLLLGVGAGAAIAPELSSSGAFLLRAGGAAADVSTESLSPAAFSLHCGHQRQRFPHTSYPHPPGPRHRILPRLRAPLPDRRGPVPPRRSHPRMCPPRRSWLSSAPWRGATEGEEGPVPAPVGRYRPFLALVLAGQEGRRRRRRGAVLAPAGRHHPFPAAPAHRSVRPVPVAAAAAPSLPLLLAGWDGSSLRPPPLPLPCARAHRPWCAPVLS